MRGILLSEEALHLLSSEVRIYVIMDSKHTQS